MVREDEVEEEGGGMYERSVEGRSCTEPDTREIRGRRKSGLTALCEAISQSITYPHALECSAATCIHT